MLHAIGYAVDHGLLVALVFGGVPLITGWAERRTRDLPDPLAQFEVEGDGRDHPESETTHER